MRRGRATTARPARTVALWLVGLAITAAAARGAETNTFAVASYNVRNWLRMERWGEPLQPKPGKEKAAVISVLQRIDADIVALSEVGTHAELAEIQDRLAARGLEYPHHEWVEALDTERHLALLSRFPLQQRQSRRHDTYRLGDRVFQMSRGILDVTITVNPQYELRLFAVHLKSRRPVEEADQAMMRLEEARLLRREVDRVLEQEPQANLLVLGDLNDEPGSGPIRLVIGRPPLQLIDLVPLDRRGASWTHYWAAQRQRSRIDYLLASPGLNHEYVTGSARVADFEDGTAASDHRAIWARFRASDEEPARAVTDAARPSPPIRAVALSTTDLLTGGAVVVLAAGLLIAFRVGRRPGSGTSSAAEDRPRH